MVPLKPAFLSQPFSEIFDRHFRMHSTGGKVPEWLTILAQVVDEVPQNAFQTLDFPNQAFGVLKGQGDCLMVGGFIGHASSSVYGRQGKMNKKFTHPNDPERHGPFHSLEACRHLAARFLLENRDEFSKWLMSQEIDPADAIAWAGRMEALLQAVVRGLRDWPGLPLDPTRRAGN